MNRPAPLYARVMGDSWTHLAAPVRCMHAALEATRVHGHLRIETGRHALARLLARMLGLPPSSTAARTQLSITAHNGRERWQRTFDGRRFETVQYASREGDLAERFGLLELRFRLDASHGSLLYSQRQAAFVCWRVRVPMPVSLSPRVAAREDPAGPNRIQIDVRVMLPLAGLLISYSGFADIEEARP